MKIHYLGTSAAEGIPGIFCSCPVCREAREKGGRYVRTRSQIMIDGKILVDFGADTYMHALKYGYDLSRISNVLITHTHSDHFYPEELRCKRKGYCKEDTVPTLRVYGSSDVKKTVFSSLSYANELCKGGRVAFIELSPYEPLDVEGYTVTAYPAKHGTDNPYFYSLSKDGKSILIMNDTARPNPEVMQKLKESGESFDLVSFECTFGNCDYFARHGDRAKHMGIVDNIAVRELLVKNGNVNDSTVYVITHFTHNGFDVGYGDMARLADRHGFILAYDGIEIEI